MTEKELAYIAQTFLGDISKKCLLDGWSIITLIDNHTRRKLTPISELLLMAQEILSEEG